MLYKEVPHLHLLLTHHLILPNNQGVHLLEILARMISGRHWLEHIEHKLIHPLAITHTTIGGVAMKQTEELDTPQLEGKGIMSLTGNSKEKGGGLIDERDRKHSEDSIILLVNKIL